MMMMMMMMKKEKNKNKAVFLVGGNTYLLTYNLASLSGPTPEFFLFLSILWCSQSGDDDP